VTREQRLVFGEVAERYDRVRPGYPESLVDEVLAYAAARAGDDMIEVGCGTGKATVSFARRGLHVVALEPDAQMAAIARRNCDGLDVSIETTSFEEWDGLGAGSSFALAISAQAWHWVRPGIRLEKAHDALRRDGALALFWNRPDWPDTALQRAIDDVYANVAPALEARTPGRSPQDRGRRSCTNELYESPLFADVSFTQHPWTTSYDSATYVELLTTQSDHRMLSTETRGRLVDGVARAIDDAGGEMEVAYVADLYVARRAGR
jgi:SAM-dependent methyltransferase